MSIPVPHRKLKDTSFASVNRVEAQCEGKRRFDSPVEMERMQRHKTRKLQMYRCPHCGGWHFSGNTDRGTMRKRTNK